MGNIKSHFKVEGLVQGVGFRYFVYKVAVGLNLKGFAKNCTDGSVEVTVEGDETAIDKLHNKLKRGPSRSNVTDVTITKEDFTGELHSFNIY